MNPDPIEIVQMHRTPDGKTYESREEAANQWMIKQLGDFLALPEIKAKTTPHTKAAAIIAHFNVSEKPKAVPGAKPIGATVDKRA